MAAGIDLKNYLDEKGQYTGENEFGLEIKHDTMLVQTGNLYIEYGIIWIEIQLCFWCCGIAELSQQNIKIGHASLLAKDYIFILGCVECDSV